MRNDPQPADGTRHVATLVFVSLIVPHAWPQKNAQVAIVAAPHLLRKVDAACVRLASMGTVANRILPARGVNETACRPCTVGLQSTPSLACGVRPALCPAIHHGPIPADARKRTTLNSVDALLDCGQDVVTRRRHQRVHGADRQRQAKRSTAPPRMATAVSPTRPRANTTRRSPTIERF